MNIPSRIKNRNTWARANIPAWLANPELLGPCICGRPLAIDEPYAVGEGDFGMKRWFHLSCWEMIEHAGEEWDDDDE